MSETKTVLILHESYAASLANDVTTLAALAGMFWVNQEYLNSAIPNWVLGTMFIFFVMVKASFGSRVKATSRDEAVAKIDAFYSASPQRDASLPSQKCEGCEGKD